MRANPHLVVLVLLHWLAVVASGCPTSGPGDDDTGDDDDTTGDDDDTTGDDDDITGDDDTTEPPSGVRVPAEWEPHAATWMQWPRQNEHWSRADHAGIIDALQEYEPIHVLVENATAEDGARAFLEQRGVPLTNLTFHQVPYDWSWMRDNGPVWAVDDGELVVQDWGFDAWGGLDPEHELDDAVPCWVADQTGARCDVYELINERGTLEFNGVDTLITSWTCLHDRNPDVSKQEMETLFATAFGVTRVIWLEGASQDDVTGGHVDGIARFIDEDTVAVARYVDQGAPDASMYEDAAAAIEAAGLEVVRIDVPGDITYLGTPMPAIYVNWLVANDAVIATGFAHPEWDAAAKAAIEGFFPGRDVHVVDTRELWFSGGGVHCVTNDQPAL